MKPVVLMGVALMLATPLAGEATAQTFRAENRIEVTPAPGGFDVSTRRGQGSRAIWCAAADYARDVLGARGVQRVYVAEDRVSGPRGAVKFTLDPAGLTPVPVFSVGASIRTAGSNLSVDHAQAFCADFRIINP